MSAVPTFDLGSVLTTISAWISTALQVIGQYMPYIVLSGIAIFLVTRYAREFKRLFRALLPL